MRKQYPTSALKEAPPSPEQQKQLELFTISGKALIEKSKADILKKIQVGKDPIAAIGEMVFLIIIRLEGVGLENGEQLDPDVELQAANVISGEIIALYESSGGTKLTEEQRFQVFSFAVSMYLDDAKKTGKITDEEFKQLDQMMRQSPEGMKIAGQMESQGQGMTKQGDSMPPVQAETKGLLA